MPVTLDPEIAARFAEQGAAKVLATIDEDGSPHVVFKGSLQVDASGRIVLLEISPQSQSGRNLARAKATGQTVAINVRSADNRSLHILGRPVAAIASGPVFDRHRRELRARRADLDLSTVWIIAADSIAEKGRGRPQPAVVAGK